jgi:hypothetical protein
MPQRWLGQRRLDRLAIHALLSVAVALYFWAAMALT